MWMALPIESFHELFGHVPDPRAARGVRHLWHEILFIAVSAILCGTDDADDMEYWGELNEPWLREHLTLPHGIPSHDTFLRVFAVLDPAKLMGAIKTFVTPMVPGAEGQICIDGKTARGSRAGGMVPAHIVSAWLCDVGLTLGQVATAAKRNEITAIPTLLASLDIRDETVTIDAMGCQRAIAQQIVDQGAHYILTVKDNQPELREQIAAAFSEALDPRVRALDESPTPVLDISEQVEKDHGRLETRRCTVMHDLSEIVLKTPWPGLATLGRIERTRHHVVSGKESHETVYVIASKPLASAVAISQGIRRHWQIENNLHWQLDVTFGEDRWTGRIGHIAENFSLLRKLALMLLAKQPVPSRKKRRSTKNKRQACNADKSYLLQVLGGLHSVS